MLSIDLRRSITSFLGQSDRYQPLFDLVQAIAKYYDDSVPHIVGQSEGGDALRSASSHLQSRFVSLHQITQTIAPSRVYRAREAFHVAITSAFNAESREHPFLRMLEGTVDSFVSVYDTFLMQQSPGNAASLMMAASNLNRHLEAVLGALFFFESAGDARRSAGEDEALVSVVLYEAESVTTFARKLSAFQDLYTELCNLLTVSEADHPLRIGKVESGSLWAQLFGESKVVKLLTSLMEETALYLHRNFTNEGKISTVPRKLKALDAAVDFSSKLKELGVDTSEMNEHLRISGVAVAKSLATLLEDQPKVSINDRVIAVAAGAEELFLAQHKTLLLPNGAERVEPTLNDAEGGAPQ